jgi:type II restriction enzyme
MVPEKPWTGIYDATGGQIVVKENGDVVCYHIYEQNRFLDYLYNNTIFEGASTSEDENNPGHPRINPKKKFFYGWLFEEDGKLYFKINLQVRFK